MLPPARLLTPVDSLTDLPPVTLITGEEGYECVILSQETLGWLIDLDPDQPGPWAPLNPTLTATLGPASDGEPARRATAPASSAGGRLLTYRAEVMPFGEPILGPYGEFLPVQCPDADIWAFHCLNIADAMDIDNSERVRWTDDGPGTPPRLLFVSRMAYHEDIARQARVFTILQRGAQGFLRLHRDVAHQLYGPASPLTGTYPRPAW